MKLMNMYPLSVLGVSVLGVNVIGVKLTPNTVSGYISCVTYVEKSISPDLTQQFACFFFFLLIWNSPDFSMTKLEGLDMVCDCLVQRKSDPSDVMYIVM